MAIYISRDIIMPKMLDEHTVFLLHGNEFADSSMYKRNVTNSGASISTAITKFGKGSMSFNGLAMVLADAYNFGYGDFTIDWWEYVTDSGGARFSGAYTQNEDFGNFMVGQDGDFVFASNAYNSWSFVPGIEMLNETYNQWIHWALVRSGNTFTSYRNGILFATYTSSFSYVGRIREVTGVPMVIGDSTLASKCPFCGYIEEFRISDIVRWAGDFTPPTEPY